MGYIKTLSKQWGKMKDCDWCCNTYMTFKKCIGFFCTSSHTIQQTQIFIIGCLFFSGCLQWVMLIMLPKDNATTTILKQISCLLRIWDNWNFCVFRESATLWEKNVATFDTFSNKHHILQYGKETWSNFTFPSNVLVILKIHGKYSLHCSLICSRITAVLAWQPCNLLLPSIQTVNNT